MKRTLTAKDKSRALTSAEYKVSRNGRRTTGTGRYGGVFIGLMEVLVFLWKFWIGSCLELVDTTLWLAWEAAAMWLDQRNFGTILTIVGAVLDGSLLFWTRIVLDTHSGFT